eukprot:scaffold89663_cov73-Phaeocystis_antarctica.AAC.3
MPLPEPEFRHVLESSSMSGAALDLAWPCRRGSCASSGRPWRPTLGAQLLPRMLERFASIVAEPNAFDPPDTLSASALSSS